MKTVTEEGETATIYEYFADGALKKVTDPTDAVTSYTYNERGDQETVTQLERTVRGGQASPGPIEFVTTYGYNGSGEMTSVTRPGDLASGASLSPAQTTTHAFGALARMQETVVDPGSSPHLARTTVHAYDADGNLCRTTVNPRSGIGEACAPTAGSGDGLNRSTVTSFDEAGRPESVVDPLGNGPVTTYNDRGLVASTTDPTGRITRHTYDGSGRQLTTTVAMTPTATPVTVETRTYTFAGRLAMVTRGSGSDATTTSYGYDAAGRQVTSTVNSGGLGLVTTTAFDKAGRPTAVTSPSGVRSSVVYAFGVEQRTEIASVPGRGQTRTVYSERDEVIATQRTHQGGNFDDPDQTATVAYKYDDRGFLSAVTDANGNTVTYVHDGRGNRVSRTSTPASTPVVETWKYNAADELVEEVQPVTSSTNQVTGYTYTAAGEVDVVSDGSGRRTDYDYRADGSVKSVTYTDTNPAPDEEVVVEFGYDDAGRRTCASVNDCDSPGGDDTLYQFGDVSGQVTSIDPPGSGNTIEVAYDTAGRRRSLTAPGVSGSVEVAYAYDGAGRLDEVDRNPTVSGEVTDYTYDADGRVTAQDLPDVGTEDQYRRWTYDPATGLLDNFDQVVDGTRRTTDTAFDPWGRLWIDWTDGTVTTYSYDDADQLVGVRRSDSVFDNAVTGDDVAYAYDGVGNRTVRVQGSPGPNGGAVDAGDGTVEFYDYNLANQLTYRWSFDKDNWRYTYDGAGRRTGEFIDNDAPAGHDPNSDSVTYAYDPAGRLEELTTTAANGTDPDTTWVDTRSYDPDGTLTGIGVVETAPDGPDTGTEPDVTDHDFTYLWDTALPVPQPVRLITDQTGATATTTYTNGLGLIGGGTDRIAAHQTGSTQYLATDVLGSTVPTPNTTSIARSHSYDEYGNPTGPIAGNTHEPALGYRGEIQPGGLVHLRAREYDSEIGTFTETDPLDGIPGTSTEVNAYAFGNNSPLELIDPLGLRADDSSFGVPVDPKLVDALVERAKRIDYRDFKTGGRCTTASGFVALPIPLPAIPALGTSDSACLLMDSQAYWLTGSLGLNGGAAFPNTAANGSSVSTGWIYSNAVTTPELTGFAVCVGGSYLLPFLYGGLGGSMEVCFSTDGSPQFSPSSGVDNTTGVWTAYIAVAGGKPGGEVHGEVAQTWAQRLHERFTIGGSVSILGIDAGIEREPVCDFINAQMILNLDCLG